MTERVAVPTSRNFDETTFEGLTASASFAVARAVVARQGGEIAAAIKFLQLAQHYAGRAQALLIDQLTQSPPRKASDDVVTYAIRDRHLKRS